MDVAVLGFEIRSEQAVKGANDLDKLTGAAKRAEKAQKDVAAASKKANAEVGASAGKSSAAAAALKAEATAAKSAAEAARVQTAANQNRRIEWENAEEVAQRLGLRMQETKSAVGQAALAMDNAANSANGAAEDVDDLGQAAGGAAPKVGLLGAALSALKAAIGNILMSALTVAIGILIAELTKLVDWLGLAKSALIFLADAIEVIAPYAVMAAAGLALLYAPAIIGGIWTVIGMLGTLSIAAVQAGISIAGAWIAAMGPVAWVIAGIAAITAAAVIFRDELTQILGFDIVGAAKDGINTIIAVFHGAYDGIVASWSRLPAAIGDLVISAANAVISGVESMINSVSGLIDGFIAKINAAMQSLPFGVGEGINIGSIGQFSLPRIPNPVSGTASQVGSAISDAFSAHMGTDYLSQFGEAVQNAASGAADKIRGLADSLGGVEAAANGAGGAVKGAAEKAIDPWKGLRKEVDKTGESFGFVKDVAKGFISDLRSGLEQGKGFFASFRDAALNALDKIIDKLLNNMLDAIFQVGSAASGIGGGGGFLGSILGGIGSLFGFANGGVFDRSGVTAFAKGGVVNSPTVFPFAKGVGLMGEAGPEAIMPLRRGPDGRLGVSAANNNQPQRVDVYVHSNDEKLRVFVQQEADGRILEATPQIVGTAVSQSRTTVVPAMAAYQQQKAGGNYRG